MVRDDEQLGWVAEAFSSATDRHPCGLTMGSWTMLINFSG
jgi:hypothetical protein